ncbi:MAG: PDDEXK nuclease domain-containing protein [Ginsengibacter sp.]
MQPSTSAYQSFLDQILEEIEQHRVRAANELNRTQMHLYFIIGKTIVTKQKAEGWGKSIVAQLAVDLKKITGATKGFSVQNLWFMRQFFLEYETDAALQQLAFKIPWGQNILILTKIKDEQQRRYYLSKTLEASWSRNTLLNQIKAKAHTKHTLLSKQHNFSKTLPSHLTEQANQILKSDYNLEFLGIAEPLLERQLENRLVENIKDFILELGYGFSYIGNQYRLTNYRVASVKKQRYSIITIIYCYGTLISEKDF